MLVCAVGVCLIGFYLIRYIYIYISPSLSHYISPRQSVYFSLLIPDQPESGLNIANNPSQTFAADISEEHEAARQIATQLKPHSNLAFMSNQPTPAWSEPAFEGRCAYIVTGDDVAVPKTAQYGMIAATGQEWIVRELTGSSHMAPFVTRVGDCVGVLNEILACFDGR